MKIVSLVIMVVCATRIGLAQTSPSLSLPPIPAAGVTNQIAGTNEASIDVVKHLSVRIDELEEKSRRDDQQVDRLQAQLLESDAKAERIGESERASRNTMLTVLYSVIGLAGISIIGLVGFCFYTLRRLTQLGEPIFDNFHKPHAPGLPYGGHAGMLPHATASHATPESSMTAVAHAGETRLLDAVDRLERKIEEMERAAHHENNHFAPVLHAPVAPPPPPSINGSPTPANGTLEPEPPRSCRQADRLVLLMNKGEALTNLGQFDKAIECFEQAILLAPTDPSPVVKKGYAMEKAGRLEEAVQCYNQAIQLDPGFSMAYLFKGGVCNRLQRYTEAIDCYDRALAVRSNVSA